MPTLHETFPDRAAANRAITDLIAQGISAGDISIVMSDATKDRLVPENSERLDDDVTRGAVAGGVAGTVAAIAGGIALGGALTIATGGVAGLAVGLMAGGLAGAGIADSEARDIETHVQNGEVVVVVRATTQNAPDVDEILRHDNRGVEPT